MLTCLPPRAVPLLSLLLVMATSPAQAREAKGLVQEALKHYQEGSYRRSLALLGEAQDAIQETKTLGTIQLYRGLNLATINQVPEARKAFAAALRFNPRLKLNARWIKPAMVALLEEIRGRIICRLEINSDPAGAEVLVNGQPRGQAPLRLQLPINVYQVELRRPDAEQVQRREVVLTDIKINTIKVNFPSSPPPLAVQPTPPRRRLWTWVLAGSAVICAGAALGVNIAAKGEAGDYNDKLSEITPEKQQLEWQDSVTAREWRDSVDAKDTIATVLFSAAGALAIGAVVLYFIEGAPATARDQDPGQDLVLAPWINDGAGLQVGYRF